MRLRTLILIRHGEYDKKTMGLNKTGKAQIKDLCSKLMPIINNGDVVILSSTAKRAIESADIFKEITGINYGQHELLWSDEPSRIADYPAALKLIQKYADKAKTIIIFTHLEYVENFMTFFTKSQLDGTNIKSHVIPKGTAWVLNCEKKTLKQIHG